MTSTPILDEINKRISDDMREHYETKSGDFEPSPIYLTPDRYVDFQNEMVINYNIHYGMNGKTWRGAEIKIVRGW